MDGQELLDTKVHQIWLSTDDGPYQPWTAYQYLEHEYEFALQAASYLTNKGYDVKLVTSIVTYVI